MGISSALLHTARRRRRVCQTLNQLEPLESRRMFSATQPTFADFSSTAGLTANGFSNAALTSGKSLQLMNDTYSQARSVWFNHAVPVGSFVSHFSFNLDATHPESQAGQGFTFTLQNGDTSQVGTSGAGLGYQGINKSVAVLFDFYSNDTFNSSVGFATDGATPAAATLATPINFHSGDTIDTTVGYDGHTLTLSMTDEADTSKTFTTSEAIDIPGTIGSSTATVGFTSGTGFATGFLDFPKWTFRSSTAPTVATPAASSPTTVTGKTSALSVLGADASGENTLKYTWSTVVAPPGAPPIVFSGNGTNAAKDVTATFGKDGGYHLRCTISNADGVFTTSDVSLRVDQTASGFRVTPHGAHVHEGKHLQFASTVLDQFGHPMRTQPQVIYSVLSGPGRIRSTSGLFTASDSTGRVTTQVAGDGLTATLTAIVEA